MLDKTHREIVTTLFRPTKKDTAATDPRTEVLVAIILDLLMEVEALRTAVLASQTETSGKDSDYARAYRDTAYLTHNAAGPSSGLEKLLAQFYPRSLEREGRDERQGRAWRECLFLRRLGFTEDEIRAYKEEAEEAEAFT